jgi:hypothetical protein
VRVIYYWEPQEPMCLMLYAYPKSKQENLTAAQLKVLRQIVREEFG